MKREVHRSPLFSGLPLAVFETFELIEVRPSTTPLKSPTKLHACLLSHETLPNGISSNICCMSLILVQNTTAQPQPLPLSPWTYWRSSKLHATWPVDPGKTTAHVGKLEEIEFSKVTSPKPTCLITGIHIKRTHLTMVACTLNLRTP